MPPPRIEFARLIRRLSEGGVEFVVVGGVAAVLQGAPIATFDLDVVHRRSPENVQRILDVLRSLEATYRVPRGTDRVPDAATLASTGHQLLMTTAGPLDLLGVVGRERDYDDLLPESTTFRLEGAIEFQVLDLEALIRTKEEAGREKDRAVLAILRRTLEERDRQ